MSVSAKINRLPVLVTDADVNKVQPPEDDDDDVEVIFGDPGDDGNEFPFCCSIGVIGGANVDDGGYGDTEKTITPKYAEQYLKAIQGEVRNRTDERCGLVLYTLTDDKVVEREALASEGFLVMAIFKNPKTSNRITLYGKLLNQPRKEPVVARPSKTARKRKTVRR